MFKKITAGLMLIAIALIYANPAEARVLSKGTSGVDVVSLQTFLIDNGFPIPLIENGGASKGYFGEQTKEAVMIYQESKGLTESGFIDSNSLVTPEPKLGSVSSPDLASPYFSYGGTRHWGASLGKMGGDLAQATNTVCALLSPVSTSTLRFGAIRLGTTPTTTGATIITLAKSATAFATTTVLGSFTVQGGATAGIVASTTQTEKDVFAPNTYFVVGIQGGTSPGVVQMPVYSASGSCEANWSEL